MTAQLSGSRPLLLWNRALSVADRFMPQRVLAAGPLNEDYRRSRTTILVSALGVLFAGTFAGLYALLGSPQSGLAISMVAIALTAVPRAVRHGRSLDVVAHSILTLFWLVTFFVGARTGGFSSPAVVWSFFHPLLVYAACGRSAATAWAGMAIVQIGAFFVADQLGAPWRQDLSANISALLTVLGFIGCVLANTLVIGGIESVRVESQLAADRAARTLDRQRILGDMHDGVGSQLLGLMVQVRADRIDSVRLLHGLESCLDDLKLIVDSLDPAERPLPLALAELNARVAPRFEAAGIELLWDLDDPPSGLSAAQTLDVLRSLQEMTANALRHSQAREVRVRGRLLDNGYEFAVSDDGVGFDPDALVRTGRGLPSLATRAGRLGATLSVTRTGPGVRLAVHIPPVER